MSLRITARLLPRLTKTRPLPRFASTLRRNDLDQYNLPGTPNPHARPPPTHRTPDGRNYEQEAHEDRVDALRHRWMFSAAGLGLVTMAYLIYTQEPQKTESPNSGSHPEIKPGMPVTLGAPSEQEKALGVEQIPSGTSNVPPFPRTMTLPGQGPGEEPGEYTLIGLGIRTVTFLHFEVYVVGFYIHADDLAAVQESLIRRIHPTATTATQPEREELRKKLLDPVEGDKVFAEMLERDGVRFRSAFRIVPARNTDFGHLRDGFVRGIRNRTTKSDAYDDEAFVTTLDQFKGLFSAGSVPKEKTLLLARDASGVFTALYDPLGKHDGTFGGEGEGRMRVLGTVKDERLSRALWLMYLGGPPVSSPPARESIVDGLMDLIERPIGTVGTATV